MLLAEGTRRILHIHRREVEVLKGDFQINTASLARSSARSRSCSTSPHPCGHRQTLSRTRAYVVERASEFLQSQYRHHLPTRADSSPSDCTVSPTYLVDLKKQFEDHEDHLGMVDEVLRDPGPSAGRGVHPGSDRDPNTTDLNQTRQLGELGHRTLEGSSMWTTSAPASENQSAIRFVGVEARYAWARGRSVVRH